MKTWLLRCLVLFGVFLATAQAQTVKVFVHESYPWSFKDTDGVVKGAEVDFIREAFQAVGVGTQFHVASYSRLLDVIQNQPELADMASPVPDEVIAASKAYKTGNYLTFRDVALIRKGSDIDIQSIDDLRGKKIIAYQAAQHIISPEFQAMAQAGLKDYTYQELPHREGQIQMLMKKRKDIVIGERQILLGLAKKLGIQDQVAVAFVVKRWNIQGMIRDKALHDAFNKGLEQIKSNGIYQSIEKKWALVY